MAKINTISALLILIAVPLYLMLQVISANVLHMIALPTCVYVSETACSAVRRLKQISNCAFQCRYHILACLACEHTDRDISGCIHYQQKTFLVRQHTNKNFCWQDKREPKVHRNKQHTTGATKEFLSRYTVVWLLFNQRTLLYVWSSQVIT